MRVSFPSVPDKVQLDAVYAPPPATWLTAGLLAPKPFLFFDLATTLRDLPDFNPLIVHEVFKFLIVHDLPPAETLLPVIFEPPLDVGKVIVTVTFTLPFLTAEEAMAEIVGDEGFAIFALACAVGAMKMLKPREVARATD
jgi:hypothetical protein